MTKTLTEQWREGKLPRGHYYCKLYYNNFEPKIQECVKSRYDSKSSIPMSCGTKDEEVLASVPSYDEWQAELDSNNELLNVQKRLEKQLAIATKALKYYDGLENIIIDWKLLTGQEAGTARKALKEMEGVK